MTIDELLKEAEEEEAKETLNKEEETAPEETPEKVLSKADKEEAEIEALLDEIDREEEAKEKKPEKKKGDSRRIRNITSLVHPEESSKKKAFTLRKEKADAEARKARKKALKEAKKADEERRRSEILEQRKVRQKRAGAMRKFRFAAGCLLVAAIIAVGMVILNFNTGGRHDDKGLKAYDEGRYEDAVSEFKEAISYDSENADYYIHLGMAYIETKNYDEALGYFNEADTCSQTAAQTALLRRGRGIACLYQGNYEEALTAFDAAADAAGNDSELKTDILYYEAEAQSKSGDLQSAVTSYTQIIDADGDAGVYVLRGEAYAAMEDYESAQADLEKAIKKSRKSYSIYRSLYEVLTAQGKTDEAQEVLNEALELSGSSGSDYFNRGMIYMDLGDTDNAREMLTKAENKGYSAALVGLGELEYAAGDHEAAKTDYEAFFEDEDAVSDAALAAKAYNEYAVCLLQEEDYESALAACQNGLALNDRASDAALMMNQIAAYEYLGQWDNAYNTAKSYVEKYPDDETGQKEYEFLESRVSG